MITHPADKFSSQLIIDQQTISSELRKQVSLPRHLMCSVGNSHCVSPRPRPRQGLALVLVGDTNAGWHAYSLKLHLVLGRTSLVYGGPQSKPSTCCYIDENKNNRKSPKQQFDRVYHDAWGNICATLGEPPEWYTFAQNLQLALAPAFPLCISHPRLYSTKVNYNLVGIVSCIKTNSDDLSDTDTTTGQAGEDPRPHRHPKPPLSQLAPDPAQSRHTSSGLAGTMGFQRRLRTKGRPTDCPIHSVQFGCVCGEIAYAHIQITRTIAVRFLRQYSAYTRTCSSWRAAIASTHKKATKKPWLYHKVFNDSPQPLKLGSMPQQYLSTSLSGCFVAGCHRKPWWCPHVLCPPLADSKMLRKDV